MALITTKNLIKTYTMGENIIHALNNISLSVNEGEFVAITGFSGSGKSTLMHILGCLDSSTSGSYFLDGMNISQATINELASIRNQKIGFVFQKFYLLPNLTAIENIALPQIYAGKEESRALKKACSFLDSVNLSHRSHHYPHQLSGGQQQRVAIARALINNPKLILADEPTGNLDTATGENILHMFKELNKSQKTTIIIVTHEPSIAAQTNRIIELIDGHIIHDKKLIKL